MSNKLLDVQESIVLLAEDVTGILVSEGDLEKEFVVESIQNYTNELIQLVHNADIGEDENEEPLDTASLLEGLWEGVDD